MTYHRENPKSETESPCLGLLFIKNDDDKLYDKLYDKHDEFTFHVGITIEAGKLYAQIVERSFHISMAALGLDCPTSEPLSVVVEVDKAQFVLCTLQAGKIPQQALDLNFTEGEEVKLFLEGKAGEVHLTGYLFDTPREVEFDEDELEDISDSDEEEATTAESEEDAVGDANGADDGMDVSSNEAESHEAADLNELDSSEDDDDISWNPTLNKTKTKAGKDSESSCGSEDSDDDGDEEDVSWHLMMNSDLKDDDDDSSGDDWSPEKGADNKKSEAITGSDKKTVSYTTKVKSKRSVSNSVSAKTPVSQTLIDLMGMDDEEEDDDDWKPSEEKSKNLKRRKKVKKQIAVEQETDLQVLDRKENVVNDEETDDKQ